MEELNVDAHQGEDCHEQAKEDKDKEDAEEDAAAHCEINLGLKKFSFNILQFGLKIFYVRSV